MPPSTGVCERVQAPGTSRSGSSLLSLNREEDCLWISADGKAVETAVISLLQDMESGDNQEINRYIEFDGGYL